jgi:dipeptidyl aminopeptidase/acylaminoacyl peptidase
MSGTIEDGPAAQAAQDSQPERATKAAADAAQPTLSVHTPGGAAVTAAVLLLHGGQVASTELVRPWSLPLARMRMFVSPLQNRSGTSGVAVALLRDRHRGWNGTAADAAVDALWALDRIAERFGPVPVVVVGHSMGGRAALRAAGHSSVTGVAALAPWVPDGEPVQQLAGRTVLIAHGDLDRQVDPAESLAYAKRAREAGVRICRLRLEGSGHMLLSRLADWNLLATDFALGMVGVKPLPAPVALALAGRQEPAETDDADDLAGLNVPLPRDWRRRWH